MLPFIAVLSGMFESIFLNDPIKQKTKSLQVIEKLRLEAENKENLKKEGWFSNLISKTKEFGDFKEKAKKLKKKLSASVDNIIDLIALFIIQTVLLPFTFLYLSIKLIKVLHKCY